MSKLTDPEGFLNEVRAAFGNLLQRGDLRIQSSMYSPESFGNAIVELTGQNFAVQVFRDRGDTMADAKPLATANWRPLDWILRAVGAVDLPPWGVMPVVQIANLVEKNIALLEAGCAPESQDATLEETERVGDELNLERQRK